MRACDRAQARAQVLEEEMMTGSYPQGEQQQNQSSRGGGPHPHHHHHPLSPAPVASSLNRGGRGSSNRPPGALLGTGYIASMLDLAPSELQDIMGAVQPAYGADMHGGLGEGGAELQRLTPLGMSEAKQRLGESMDELLRMPISEVRVRNSLMALLEERINLERALWMTDSTRSR